MRNRGRGLAGEGGRGEGQTGEEIRESVRLRRKGLAIS
jgi:hypothetical protein